MPGTFYNPVWTSQYFIVRFKPGKESSTVDHAIRGGDNIAFTGKGLAAFPHFIQSPFFTRPPTFQPDPVLEERRTFATWRSWKNGYRFGAGCGILSGRYYCPKRVVASKRWEYHKKTTGYFGQELSNP
jgi:hypothetical protein